MGISAPGRGCSHMDCLRCCLGDGVSPQPCHPFLSWQHQALLSCSCIISSPLRSSQGVLNRLYFSLLIHSSHPSRHPLRGVSITPATLRCPSPPWHLPLPALAAGRLASSSRSWGTSAAGAMASCRSPRSASSAHPSSTSPAATARSSPMGSTGRSSAGTSGRRARSRR